LDKLVVCCETRSGKAKANKFLTALQVESVSEATFYTQYTCQEVFAANYVDHVEQLSDKTANHSLSAF